MNALFTGLSRLLPHPVLKLAALSSLVFALFPGRAAAQWVPGPNDPYVLANIPQPEVSGWVHFLLFGLNLQNPVSVHIGEVPATIVTGPGIPNDINYISCKIPIEDLPDDIEFPYYDYVYVVNANYSGQSDSPIELLETRPTPPEPPEPEPQIGDNGVLDLPGEVAFLSYATDPDGFSFLLLDDCPDGTAVTFVSKIRFGDWDSELYLGPGQPIRTLSGAITWTNDTGADIAKGTVIHILNADDDDALSASMGGLSVVESGFNLNVTTIAESGVLFAVTGTYESPEVFLAYIGTLIPTADLSGNYHFTAGDPDVHAHIIDAAGYYAGPSNFNGLIDESIRTINDSDNWTFVSFSQPAPVPASFTGAAVHPEDFVGSTTTTFGEIENIEIPTLTEGPEPTASTAENIQDSGWSVTVVYDPDTADAEFQVDPNGGSGRTASLRLGAGTHGFSTIRWTRQDDSAFALQSFWLKSRTTDLPFVVTGYRGNETVPGASFSTTVLGVPGDSDAGMEFDLSGIPSFGNIDAFWITFPDGVEPLQDLNFDNIMIADAIVPNREIAISGNNVDITSGDTTPSFDDHTDFGDQSVSSGSVTRTFTISNSGSGALILNGDPLVAVAGTHADDFTVVAQPADTTLDSDGNTTFTVQFAPSEEGLRSATLSVASDDADENPYTFTIQGTGTVQSFSVSSVTTPDEGSYKAGDTLSFIVTFSGPVDVTGTPLLDFTLGTADRNASYASGSGTTSLTFTYTIASGDDSTEGVSITSPLDLNGGSIVSSGETANILLNLPATDPAQVVVDTVAPQVPSVPDLIAASDSGADNTDNITRDTTPTFTGTAEDGMTVKLYAGSGTILLGSTTANEGVWEITTNELADGDYTLSASATDDAGNTQGYGDQLVVSIDTTAPVLTSATTVNLTVGIESAYSLVASGDPISFTFDSTLPNGLTLNGSTGAISGTPNTLGATALTATITDAAGNSSAETITFNIASADDVAPTIVSITIDGDPEPDAQEITYKVGFSEPVLNVNLEDFQIDLVSGFAEGIITQAVENDDRTEVLVRATLNGNLYGNHPSTVKLSINADLVDIVDLSGNALGEVDASVIPEFASNLTTDTTTGTLNLVWDADDIPASSPFQLNTQALGVLIPQIASAYPNGNPMRLAVSIQGFGLNEHIYTGPEHLRWANLPFSGSLNVETDEGFITVTDVSGNITLTGTVVDPTSTSPEFGYTLSTVNVSNFVFSNSKIGALNGNLSSFKFNLASAGVVTAINESAFSRLRFPLTPLRINEVKFRDDGSNLVEFIEFYDGGIGNTTTRAFSFAGDGSTISNWTLDPFPTVVTNSSGYYVMGSSDTPNVDFTPFDTAELNATFLEWFHGESNGKGVNVDVEDLRNLHPLPLDQAFSLNRLDYSAILAQPVGSFSQGNPTPGAPNTVFLHGNSFSIEENSANPIDLQAFGGDPDDIDAGVSYAITGGADSDLFTIDASTGELSFATAPDYEVPTDADANNVYIVEVSATLPSPFDITDTRTFIITVTDVDEVAPDAPSDLALAASSDSGTSDSDRLTNDTTPTFTGTAEAGATVRLYDTDGTTELGSAVASDGSWEITSSVLSEGVHTVTTTATDAAGNVSNASTGLSLTIDTTAPTISNLAIASFTYGQGVEFEIMATGASSYATTTSLPAGLSLNPTTGALVGLPSSVGNLTSTFQATDDAGNYAERSIAFTVNPAPLSVLGLTATSKTYDGTTTTSLGGSASLSGIFGSDDVQLDGSSAIAAFASASVGTGKMVDVTGFTLTGTDAANYRLTQPSGLTANITPQTLSVTGITAEDKIYDRSVEATLNVAAAELVGVIGNDDVILFTHNATGSFADHTIGTDILVTIHDLSIGGAHAANYVFTPPSTTASITPAPVSFEGIVAENKTYDGTRIATLDTSNGLVYGVIYEDGFDITLDESAVVVTFDDAAIGTDKPVTVTGYALTGPAASNYTLEQPTGLTADITPAELTISGVTASNKVYDSTTAAGLNTSAAELVGVVDDEDVTLTGTASGAFADANIGTAKPIVVSGYSLAGEDIANYTLTAPTATADITPAEIRLSGLTTTDRPYDATINVEIDTTNLQLIGVQGSDEIDVDTSALTASFFNDADVGYGKVVILDGLVLTGPAAGNYTLTYPSDLIAAVLPVQISVEGITASNKVYDGTALATADFSSITLHGIVGTEDVLLNTNGVTASFDAPMVGAARTVSFTGLLLDGPASPNYTLVPPTTTADITPATVTVTGITAATKTYDADFTATLDFGAAELIGVVTGDDVALVTSSATGTFASADIGKDLTVSIRGLTLIGSDTANYLLVTPIVTAEITAAELTIPGLSVGDKTYDATTTASLDGSDFSLVGIQDGDDVQLSGGTATANFADKQVGTDKPVTVTATITGSTASNYTLTLPTDLTADITAAELTVTGAAVTTKVYDASDNAPLDFTGASLVGTQGTDDIALESTHASGTYADADIGTAKAVTYSGLSLTGADAGNYTLSAPTLTGDITAALITVTADALNKPYGDPNPELTYTYTGFITGEDESVITGEPVLATDATRISAIGDYTITVDASPLSATNYTFSAVGADFTVTTGYHFADTDRDHAIGLSELLRVIELYNTRAGTRRTGAYQSDDTTSDRYKPGDGTRILPHTADSNGDGRFSLLELTRVIELYNTRSGSTRTGAYIYSPSTEDGFAPSYDAP